MGKNRKSKRQLVRDERRKKKRDRRLATEESGREAKRLRIDSDVQNEDFIAFDEGHSMNETATSSWSTTRPEKEFFGMLADEEQEYFRHADELLELNDFPSPEERDIFLQNVYKEAEGKELKLASSQSCSRLMERLILLSNTKQKKHLFEKFAGHFLSLVTHRFASHCCEKLFLESAPIATEELAGSHSVGSEDESSSSMEDLFLLTLDELEEHLSYLLSDRYASHAIRVLLIILSGRPLNEISTKSLLQSKKKERITVLGAQATSHELASQTREVPPSFSLAVRKIISDSTANMDSTALRILATHPTGNPVLQLLLELDISLNLKPKPAKEKEDGEKQASLLDRLIPGAPATFNDESSTASDFIKGMLYDPIGSRLLETLITHCPGKVFKGLQANFFGPRIHNILRNDIASYPAIRVLNRLNKEDLADAVEKSLPQVPVFLEKGRFNVLKTFFERCAVRKATAQIDSLLKAVLDALGGDSMSLVPRLCGLDIEIGEMKNGFQHESKNQSAVASHGSQLVATMLGISGSPSKAVQSSISTLSSDHLLRMATASVPTANVLTAAFSTAAEIPGFHKILVAALIPHIMELASSQQGQNVLNAIVGAPSKGDGIAVPFHLKEVIISKLAEHEREIRESWVGRNVWRTWKGDLWSHRRAEWVRWAKETDPEDARRAAVPKPRQGGSWQDKWKKQSSRAAGDGVGVKRKQGQSSAAPIFV
ncbi:hypothetical protein VTK73DRAFT_9673 [Phialemonium thermophilum]|uniref:Nucleolar protein 9 n=1 Tax=Phialemonium thermophilum TaxID=223376 RepID=A0ABR3XKB2_9PEZI